MVPRIVLTLAFGLALNGCAGGGSYVRSDAALGRVVVYQNGIAYFERNADLSDDELVLRVPADKVDDFLKSLTVVDQATGQPVATARPSILPTTDAGIVEMRIALAGPKPHRVRLAYVTDAPAWKPTYRLLLGKGGKVGLQGWAIVDNVSGEDWDNVMLGVASSSALSFKFDLRSLTRSHSRFRIEGLALDGEPDPTAAGLARAERARQQLLARGIGAERIETAAAGVRRGEGATVRIVELPPKNRLALLRDTVLAGGLPAPLQAPVGAAHFESPAPVTVPRGSSTLLSMVSAQTPGEVVYLYDPESARGNADFAFQAVRFVNPTDSVLDSGPVTVLADGRFVGEGLCEPIPSRSVAFVPFALDRQVRVERKDQDGEHMARIISAARGVLTAEVQRTRQSTLVLRNALPEPATVYVRHTVAPGYTLTKGQVEHERVGSAYLFRVQVPAAGQTELVIEESTPVERTLDVRSPADRASVSVYVSEVPADGPLRAELATILQKATAIADIEERLGSARDQAREYRQRMDEVHGQIVTLRAVKSANALVTTLENTLRDVTDAVSKSTSAVVGLQQDLLVARVSFQQEVSGLSLQKQPKP